MRYDVSSIFKNKDLLDPIYRKDIVNVSKQFEDIANSYSEDIRFVRLSPLLKTMVCFKVFIPSRIDAMISRPTRLLGYVEIYNNGDCNIILEDDKINFKFILSTPEIVSTIETLQGLLRYSNKDMCPEQLREAELVDLRVSRKNYDLIEKEIKYEDTVRMSRDKSYINNDILTSVFITSLLSLLAVYLYYEDYISMGIVTVLLSVNVLSVLIFLVFTVSTTISVKRMDKYKIEFELEHANFERELALAKGLSAERFRKSNTM